MAAVKIVMAGAEAIQIYTTTHSQGKFNAILNLIAITGVKKDVYQCTIRREFEVKCLFCVYFIFTEPMDMHFV